MSYSITTATDTPADKTVAAVTHVREVALESNDLAGLQQAIAYLVDEVNATPADLAAVTVVITVGGDGRITMRVEWTPARVG
jgi:type IV secretory pathway VirB2 component (pilin)